MTSNNIVWGFLAIVQDLQSQPIEFSEKTAIRSFHYYKYLHESRSDSLIHSLLKAIGIFLLNSTVTELVPKGIMWISHS